MFAEPPTEVIDVGVDADISRYAVVDEPDVDALLAAARSAHRGGRPVWVRPDLSAQFGQSFDHEQWVAAVSVLVREGVAVVQTEHPQMARRIVATGRAIRAGDTSVLHK